MGNSAIEYGTQLMEGLAVLGTRDEHVNMLQHLMGYLKNDQPSENKAYLGNTCDSR